MFCITSTKLHLLWNREVLHPITPQRGLRQGEVLSLYLFVLCTEVLGQMITAEVDKGRWKAVKPSRHGPSISHIFFCRWSNSFWRSIRGSTLKSFFVWWVGRRSTHKNPYYFLVEIHLRISSHVSAKPLTFHAQKTWDSTKKKKEGDSLR